MDYHGPHPHQPSGGFRSWWDKASFLSRSKTLDAHDEEDEFEEDSVDAESGAKGGDSMYGDYRRWFALREDNVRFWECFGMLRIDPTLSVQSAIYKVTQMPMSDFFHQNMKRFYSQHFLDREAREVELMRMAVENPRLHAILWVLSDNSNFQVDSVVAAIFRLSEEEFKEKFNFDYVAGCFSGQNPLLRWKSRNSPYRPLSKKVYSNKRCRSATPISKYSRPVRYSSDTSEKSKRRRFPFSGQNISSNKKCTELQEEPTKKNSSLLMFQTPLSDFRRTVTCLSQRSSWGHHRPGRDTLTPWDKAYGGHAGSCEDEDEDDYRSPNTSHRARRCNFNCNNNNNNDSYNRRPSGRITKAFPARTEPTTVTVWDGGISTQRETNLLCSPSSDSCGNNKRLRKKEDAKDGLDDFNNSNLRSGRVVTLSKKSGVDMEPLKESIMFNRLEASRKSELKVSKYDSHFKLERESFHVSKAKIMDDYINRSRESMAPVWKKPKSKMITCLSHCPETSLNPLKPYPLYAYPNDFGERHAYYSVNDRLPCPQHKYDLIFHLSNQHYGDKAHALQRKGSAESKKVYKCCLKRKYCEDKTKTNIEKSSSKVDLEGNASVQPANVHNDDVSTCVDQEDEAAPVTDYCVGRLKGCPPKTWYQEQKEALQKLGPNKVQRSLRAMIHRRKSPVSAKKIILPSIPIASESQ